MINEDSTPFRGWLEQFGFDERQIKEIEFADTYTHGYRHGTDGHNRLLLVSKLAEAIDQLTAELNRVNAPKTD